MTPFTTLPQHMDGEFAIVADACNEPLPIVRHIVQRSLEQLLASGKARVECGLIYNNSGSSSNANPPPSFSTKRLIIDLE
jgi:hypothetical protein